MHSALNDFYNQLSTAKSESDAGATLIDFICAQGAEGCNIWYAVGNDNFDVVNSSASTYPDGLIEYMYENGRCNKKNIEKRIAGELAPIRYGWDVAKHCYEKGSCDYQYARMFHDEIGDRNTLIIPISVPGRIGSSGVGFYSNEPSERFDMLLNDKDGLLQLAAYAGHLQMQSLLQRRLEKTVISDKQKECLLWAARGLTLKDTADKIGKSEHTVDWHLRKAREALSVGTTREAVAKAIVLKLISP